MWSPELSRRVLCCIGSALLVLGLTACFKPLYGPTASGAMLQDVLASVEISPIVTPLGQERLGQDLRSELTYLLNGSGVPHAARYRLVINVTESVGTPIVNSTTGRVDTASLTAQATYTLNTLDGRAVMTGSSRGSANYNRDSQRFAAVRAARDADQRVARMMADDIRTRLGTTLTFAP